MQTLVNYEKLTYSVPEAAEILGISKSRMYELTRSEGFPSLKIGKRILVPIKGLERWVEKQAASAMAAFCE